MLLEPEVGLFESLIGSVLGVDNSTGGVCALSKASTSNLFTFTIDSGSTVHVLTLEAAQQLLHWKERSHLQIVGVSGSSSRADVCGHLLICVRDPHSGAQYLIDLGIAHGMKDCPLNILSVALLMKAGAVIHFEEGACYFKPFREAPKISFEQLDSGLFQIKGEDAYSLPGALIETSPNQAKESNLVSSSETSGTGSDFKWGHSYSVNGHCFATSADLSLWHRRLGHHLPKSKLVQIFKHNLVDGFKVRGRLTTHCSCRTCAQAKIQRQPVQHQRTMDSEAEVIGHTVSSDTKEVPYKTFKGFNYCINFVDHKSRFTLIYYMRNKNESTAKLRQYVADMGRLGVKVHNIQTDRGSEFFEQENESPVYGTRREHEFRAYCHSQGIRHIVRPTEMKEHLAEQSWKERFRAVNVMLWDGRLCSAFWADACEYSQVISNLTPSEVLGGNVSPWEMVTGRRPRWDALRVFGCDCYAHIPNNKLAKVPGIPRGKKLIFLGFQEGKSGFKCFDLEKRLYVTVGNVYFYEDNSGRIDTLRHHDRRRDLLRQGIEPPIVLDDFVDSNSHAVRQLFLNPNTQFQEADVLQSPSKLQGDVQLGGAEAEHLQPGGAAAEAPAVSAHPSSAQLGGASHDSVKRGVVGDLDQEGPLSDKGIATEKMRSQIQGTILLRPLRLTRVGKEQPLSVEDRKFIKFAIQTGIPIAYHSPNPKSIKYESGRRYQKYMAAKSTREAFELGATKDDFDWDYARGWISFPKHEPILQGHVFDAMELAKEHNNIHVLKELGHNLGDTRDVNVGLAKSFSLRGKVVGVGMFNRTFNDTLQTIYEPEVILEQLQDAASANRFAEEQAAKVLNSVTDNISWAIAPDPVKFEETQPDVCGMKDHLLWKQAMDDEMGSMERFGVFKRVPREAARGKQLLGCRWVYKRKIGKNGEVTRYRARLVAQGYAQRAYSSYQPDEIFSPVVHKDTLRLSLSIAAAQDLCVYTADIKAAFLQSPLLNDELIYLKAPPGYEQVDEHGNELVLELHHAIYGLKQSSACFYTALAEHLRSLGFVSFVGDPCLFKKELPTGKVVYCAVYVDDLTYAVSDQGTADSFLADIRQRFEVAEDQGKPIDFLLGMAIEQNLKAGTIHINMEMMITKLAKGILTAEELVKGTSVRYPMLVTPLQKQSERTVSKELFDYLSVVGSLLHIANCVRPDISTAVGILARHAICPGAPHVKAAKRVVQYLWNTKSLGITYSKSAIRIPKIFEGAKHPLDDGTNKLQTFVDADYAMDVSRKSTYGYVLMLNGGPVSWGSTLGKTVATSTCEAEISAAVVACREAVHFKGMLVEFGIMSADSPLQVAEDNSAALAQAQVNGLRHVRNAKHYEVRLAFLQQLVVDG